MKGAPDKIVVTLRGGPYSGSKIRTEKDKDFLAEDCCIIGRVYRYVAHEPGVYIYRGHESVLGRDQ